MNTQWLWLGYGIQLFQKYVILTSFPAMQNKVEMQQDHRYQLEAVQIFKNPLQQCYPNLVTTDIGAAIPVSCALFNSENNPSSDYINRTNFWGFSDCIIRK